MLTSVIAATAPSHVPFFIAGGVLAVWAVVLSWFGLRRPAFPSGPGGQFAVAGVSLVLAVVTVAMAIVTA